MKAAIRDLARRRVLALFLLTPAALAGCERLLVEPAKMPSRVDLAVSYHVAPRFSKFVDAGAAYDKADRVRVKVAHGEGVLLDTVVAFSPAPEVRLRLPLEIEEPIPQAQVIIEILRGTEPLFFGTETVSLTPGEATSSTAAAVGLMPRPAGIAVPPSVQMDAVGDTLQLTGAAVFATGDTVPDSPVTWSTPDSSIVHVSPSGRIVSRANGTARVVGLAAGHTDTTRVTVLAQRGPAKISLSLAGTGGPEWQRADSLWLHLNRAGTSVLDTILPYDPAQPVTTLSVEVAGTRAQDTLSVAVELRQGVHPVVRGISSTIARPHESVASQVTLASVVSTVAVGAYHACGLTADGAAYCWGRNGSGQIGNAAVPWIGTTTPAAVSGGLRFESVTAGFSYACGVSASGQAYCWGMNNIGQMGTGTVAPSWPFAQTAPEPVSGGISFAAVNAGGDWSGQNDHLCGLTRGGEAYCWGSNADGQLGTGGGSSTTPSRVSTPIRFTTLSAGTRFTCGVSTGGEGYCWGDNESGQLGNGSVADAALPVRVSGGLRFVTIEAGLRTACGVTAAGEAYCWGSNSGGSLGNGTGGGQSSLPSRVVGGMQFTSVSIGQDYTCGIAIGGAAHCWGGNYLGRMGTGTLEGNTTPREVVGGHRFTSLATGTVTTCARSTTGTLSCWGAKELGQIGDGSVGLSDVPVPVSGALTLAQTTTGRLHACGLEADGEAYCWGANGSGQLGRGSVSAGSSAATPVQAATGMTFSSISAGASHTCALTPAGQAYCWGENTSRQLGNPSVTDRYRGSPVPVSGSHTFQTIEAGWYHTCALTTTGAAYCWGSNAQGQVGDGTSTTPSDPVAVAGGLTFTSIRAAAHHTCAVTSTGAAYCWGNNEYGQLGNGTRTGSRTPVPVSGGLQFRVVDPGGTEWSMADSFTCGIATDGAAYCWGSESGCTLGNQSCTANAISSPVAVVGGLRFSDLSSGGGTSCGVSTNGNTYCWGSNFQGQLGIGFRNELIGSTQFDPGSGQPMAIANGLSLASVELGVDTACGLTSAGRAYCWGPTGYGTLGNGTLDYVLTPTPVAGGLTFR